MDSRGSSRHRRKDFSAEASLGTSLTIKRSTRNKAWSSVNTSLGTCREGMRFPDQKVPRTFPKPRGGRGLTCQLLLASSLAQEKEVYVNEMLKPVSREPGKRSQYISPGKRNQAPIFRFFEPRLFSAKDPKAPKKPNLRIVQK